MDSMLEENKNLKDISKDSLKDSKYFSQDPSLLPPLYKGRVGVGYTKINKLITALYMVTDTLEKEEPLRLKLRTLGIEILSDIDSLPRGTLGSLEEKIVAILSFLNIAFDVGMVSEMNSNILRKEFVELKESIQEFKTKNHLWLEEFLKTSEKEPDPYPTSPLLRGRSKEGVLSFAKGHPTRIGVQKGSTLMKALSKKISTMSDRNKPAPYETEGFRSGFDILRKQRQEEIIKIIKARTNGTNIKDIASTLKSLGKEIGDKTLQRELVSMVKDNVLKKTGEKRWSLYFLKLTP
jgi:hypothetical protein